MWENLENISVLGCQTSVCLGVHCVSELYWGHLDECLGASLEAKLTGDEAFSWENLLL